MQWLASVSTDYPRSKAAGVIDPSYSKKGRGQRYCVGRGLYSSNVRLIATMRSRSKKGEAGLCCAQPCDRPRPIVIMVLPTEIQPDSLILLTSAIAPESLRVLYRLQRPDR